MHMGNELEGGTNKSLENREAVHAILLFQWANLKMFYSFTANIVDYQPTSVIGDLDHLPPCLESSFTDIL